jgi:HD-like signal output (HDOD) protein
MRILLVDGDGNLLKAARQDFWQSHRTWEVLLAPTGAEAVAILSRDTVDIVIIDMHLPDMDGADLIHRVRECQPGAVRIALADHAMDEWLEKSEGDLHRIFIKPVEPSRLIGAVESLDIEDDETRVRAVRAFVGGLGRIPSLPSLYSELVALLQREDAGMGEVARLIRHDLGVASQVLKLANSVHCASGRPVSEIGQALAMLGMDSLKSLVLFRGLISGFDSPRPQGLDLEKLWFHSFQVASGTRKLAVLEGETQLADLAFSVGLLHDVGMVVLATDPSGRYRAVLEQAQTSRIPLAILEHETYGVDHSQVGAHLLNLWGLPPEFCRPVREHHAPPAEAGGFPLSKALHLSDAKHGGGAMAGLFADGRWGLHPNVLVNHERFARWKACLAMDEAGLEPDAK